MNNMKINQTALKLSVMVGVGLMTVSISPASGMLTIAAVESDGDVIVTGAGSLNLAGWTLVDSRSSVDSGSIVTPHAGVIQPRMGFRTGISLAVWFDESPPEATIAYDMYSGPDDVCGPLSLSSDYGEAYADDGSSLHSFGWWVYSEDNKSVTSSWLMVPQGYRSGSLLYGSMTFSDSTFESLGLTPGIYEWTWGNAASGTFDSVQLVVVPEPSPSALAAVGVAALLVLRRRV